MALVGIVAVSHSQALAEAVVRQHDGAGGRERLVARFAEMHHVLAQGCARRVAETVLDDLSRA